jgi:hypothetical protein
MKLISFAMLAAVCGLAGCGGGPMPPISSPLNITGNWQMTATSAAAGTVGAATPFSIYLTADSGMVSGTLFAQAVYPVFACIYPFTDINGKLAGTVDAQGNLSMKSIAPTADGSVFTLKGLAASGTLSGSYTIAGGCTADGGTVAGIALPAMNGTYKGTVTSTNTGATMAVTATLMQASAPNAAGELPVTGTASFSGGQSCLSSLSVQSSDSFLYGEYLSTGLAASPASPGTAGFSGGLSTDGKTLNVTYDVSPDVCTYDYGKGTLTLQ